MHYPSSFIDPYLPLAYFNDWRPPRYGHFCRLKGTTGYVI